MVWSTLLLVVLGGAAAVFAWFAPGRGLVAPGPWSWVAGGLLAASVLALVFLFLRYGPAAILGVLRRDSLRMGTDRPPAFETYPTAVLVLALVMGLGILAWGIHYLVRGLPGRALYHAIELAAAGLVLSGFAGVALLRKLRRRNRPTSTSGPPPSRGDPPPPGPGAGTPGAP